MILTRYGGKNWWSMPCKQVAGRKEREEYISKNMKEVGLYKGVEDRVEIISMIHTSHDPLVFS
jgi:hypothetical protein